MSKMTFIENLTIKEIETILRSDLAVMNHKDNNFDNTVVDVRIKSIKLDDGLYSDDEGEGCGITIEAFEQRIAIEATGYKVANNTPVEETFYYEMFWDCEDGYFATHREITEEEYNNFGKGE